MKSSPGWLSKSLVCLTLSIERAMQRDHTVSRVGARKPLTFECFPEVMGVCITIKIDAVFQAKYLIRPVPARTTFDLAQ
jgi:hypothetical protein